MRPDSAGDPGESILKLDVAKRLGEFELRCSAAFGPGITAVFGPSGSGKTTLLNCVAGLARPDRGEIEVLGRTVYSSSRRVNVPPERRGIGYVFQDSALFPHLSVRENIRYGHRLTPEAGRVVSLERVVDLLRLEPLMDRGVLDLSGGEGQRVALARALAASPRLLLLDEPISSLDLAFRGLILRYLKQVRDELSIPMVYVSHSMSEVMALADDVLALRDGAQIAQGRPSTVLANPGLSRTADYAALENLIDADVVGKRADGWQAELDAGGSRLLAPGVEAEPGERVTVSIQGIGHTGRAGRPRPNQRPERAAGGGRRDSPPGPARGALRGRGGADDGRDHTGRAGVAGPVRGRPGVSHHQEHEHRRAGAGQGTRFVGMTGAQEGNRTPTPLREADFKSAASAVSPPGHVGKTRTL